MAAEPTQHKITSTRSKQKRKSQSSIENSTTEAKPPNKKPKISIKSTPKLSVNEKTKHIRFSDEEKDNVGHEAEVRDHVIEKSIKRAKRKIKKGNKGGSNPREFEEGDPTPYLQYLNQFHKSNSTANTLEKSNQSSWKFNKSKQSWLLKHIFTKDKIPDGEYWKWMTEYLEGLKGSSKEWIISKAKEITENETDDDSSSWNDGDSSKQLNNETNSDEELSPKLNTENSASAGSVDQETTDLIASLNSKPDKVRIDRRKQRELQEWKFNRAIEALRILSS